MLGAHFNPSGKIATRHTLEPGMADYIKVVFAGWGMQVVKRFGSPRVVGSMSE